MNNNYPETEEVTMTKDGIALEEELKAVWEKVRLATHLITQLRDEKRSIATRAEDLERQVAALRSDLQSRDTELKRVRAEHAQIASSNGQQSFSEEEREAVKNRIRELISKINSYL